MSDISDVISTASLLLAVVTALMGFWYADVTKAISETEPTLPKERETVAKRIAPVFWAKALPLALGSVVIASVFLWRAWNIALEALRSFGTDAKYDDLKAAFLATEVLMILLAVVTCTLAWRLGRKRWRLR
ncbi:hypothetical protein HGP13_33670 [Mesorhizobium sp. NZP2077]|uniref:hypothetical protein n=1 Tax=Mesorhizobium sp. NZP2077 TaxID=2483404 RepID=UPI001553E4A4|nr:hypothetical protein [Mesorhizobium sp. NZP2077]QKD19520.1 hypothetical protein HGP13_33670 [Mesorhizobium sp. NZP2077]